MSNFQAEYYYFKQQIITHRVYMYQYIVTDVNKSKVTQFQSLEELDEL